MNRSKIAAALLLAMSAAAMSVAKADTISYYFSNAGLYNGVNLNYTDAFASATFTDISTGKVQLTMSVNPGLNGSYVNDWAFNVNTGGFSGTLTATSAANTTIATKVDINDNQTKNFGSSTADFYLQFGFANGNPGQITSPGSSTYILSATNLDAADFNFANPAGYFNAVHVQGGSISESSYYSGGTHTDGSGPGTSVNVPEPGTVATLGLGMLGLAFVRRRKSK